MPCLRPLFNRATRLLCWLAAAGAPFHETEAQACPGVRAGRLVAIGGLYVGAEAAAIAVRGGDWWTSPGRSFYLTWDHSPSAGQDRLLHAAIGYHASQAAALAFRWACLPPVPAAWLGAALGVAAALPKEIGDGLHQDKGFSAPDMLWTALGSALPAAHQTWPASQGVTLKVSYWPSQEYRHRTGSQPRLESDYAGQVYYLALAPREMGVTRGWPRWLGIGVGHSVPYWASQPPVHEWYVTLDLRARGLAIKPRWWRPVAWVLDQVHVPLPGVRLREGTWALGFF